MEQAGYFLPIAYVFLSQLNGAPLRINIHVDGNTT